MTKHYDFIDTLKGDTVIWVGLMGTIKYFV